MDKYLNILKQQEHRLAPGLLKRHRLVCKQLTFEGTAPLYVAKPHWTNRFDAEKDSTIGLFFAIWVTPQLIERKQFAYNLHSKQLRNLPGYKVTSRKFASEFRIAIKDKVSDWPEISLDYGPVTLFEGRDSCERDSFAQKVEQRVTAFVKIHAEVDTLLAGYAA